MKIRTLLITLSVFFSLLANAQAPPVNVQIKGQVVDSLTNDPVSYATIKVLGKASPALIKAVAADDKGKFQFPMNKIGEYIISIEYIGKNTIRKEITIADQKVIDLGKMLMGENSQTLSEVVISAQKPLVQVDLDKIVYSMESDPEAKTNNVLDMLKKVPMITVDGEENIQLKGSTSFKIYLNGKPSNMITSNPRDVLRSMPAHTVKDIQVITDPGAKYDAEGVTGIINIITQSNSSMGGYTASLNANVDDQGGFGGGAYVSMKYGKIGFTGNYNYNRWKSPKGESSSFREDFRNTPEALDNKYSYSNGWSKNRNDGQYGSGELSYEIDTLNLINIGFSRFYGDSKNSSESLNEMLDINKNPFYRYEQSGNFKRNYGGTDVNMDYQRTFKKKDQLFTASYRFSLSPNDSESNSDIDVLLGTPPPTVVTNKQYSDADMKEHTFQADFVTPFGKIHNLEAGLKYIIRINESTSGYDKLVGSDWENVSRPLADRFKHEQDILSAYGGYSAKFKKWGVKAGLRYEATWLDAKFPIAPTGNFKTDYGNLVPSATITYQLKPAQNIRFGYNMRISRPSIWQLNPNEDSSDPSNIRQGNPGLDAVKSHSVNANYGFFSPKLNFNMNLSYDFQDNAIESFTSLIGKGVTYTIYENAAKRKNLGLNGYINWSPNQKIRLYSNLSGRYSDMKSNISNDKNHGFSGHMWGGAQYSFPKSLKVYLNFGGSTPYISLQGEGSSYFFHSLSISKGFMKDRLNFRAYAQNPFQKNNEWKNKTQTEEFFRETLSTNRMRRFGFSVSFRFGEMKEQIKKARRGITNDDSMGGGQGSQGGGQSGGGGGQN